MKLRKSLLLLIITFTTGCDLGFQAVEAGETGIVFSAIPPILGGGLKDKIIDSGEKEFIWPWQKLIKVDTSLKVLSWGEKTGNDGTKLMDLVETRTLGGNEVGLSITIKYRLDPNKLHHIVQYVGSDSKKIENLINAVARADIRTHMNSLSTVSYFDNYQRKEAASDVQKSLANRLGKEGIIIEQVIYQGHRFQRSSERESDDQFQQLIIDTQELLQNTEQERFRRAAEIQKLKSMIREAEGLRDKKIKEALGNKSRIMLETDAYFDTKKHEAEQIVSVGKENNRTLAAQINALNGEGGRAILRQEIAEALKKAAPNFIILNSKKNQGNSLTLDKVDINQLLNQFGLVEGLKDNSQKSEESSLPSPSLPAKEQK